MEPESFTSSPVVWLVTEDIHLIRADTITSIGVTRDQLTVWQGDRATTVVQVGERPQFSTNYAGLLAQYLAADPPLDHEGKPFPVVYVWLYLDDVQEPCWQVAVAGSNEYADPPEPPFNASTST
ncbi:hypothetical protein AGRA3207_001749 [Actinomadura graeca]|uniref:ASCH domain-containing protein n=1 Tax=Actinomadura graeca TaxID=2750812 RepID=A0ABX8QVZ1_9ACTN|nr:hypothetical protein [Actinomadura graeca]QXJ20948.1 hypothetical protein AGRA3207_001749 [Actinomadura graeca]